MIVDGRAIAAKILEEVKRELKGQLFIVRAVTVAPTAVTQSYLRIKQKAADAAGITLEVVEMAEDTPEQQVIDAVTAEGADAVIVQLPLPASYDTRRILNAIPITQDADVLSQGAYNLFLAGGSMRPPVVAALREVLSFAGRSEITGTHTVVVGNGRLVGAPAAAWLNMEGANVSVIYKGGSESSADNEYDFADGQEQLKNADVVVTGAGVPRLITPERLKTGVVLIDAGASEDAGAVVGDADPACAVIASVFTPVPGGMGPCTVACLLRNALELRKPLKGVD